MSDLLHDETIATELRSRTNWQQAGRALVRSVDLPNFPAAIEAVGKIGDIAEGMDHHPDIDIRWRTLHFSLSTHSAGGITANDFALADSIDTVLAEYAR